MHSRQRGVAARLPFFFIRLSRSRAFWFVLLTGLCLVCYSNTIPNPFIFDDAGLIIKNPAVASSPLSGDFLRKDLYASSFMGSNFYRPLQALSFMSDFRFWGLRPQGYHLTNIVLHALVSFLAYLFLLALTRDFFIAGSGALLFCVSPIHTESVAYISGRAEPLMALCILSAFLAFHASQRTVRFRVGYLIVSLMLFVFALLAKELAVVFPLVLLAWAYHENRLKQPWFATVFILPFFVTAALYALLRLTVLRFSPLLAPDLYQYPLWLRFVLLPRVLWTYARIMAVPAGLHMSWTLARPLGTLEILVCAAGAFSALFLSGYMLVSRRFPSVVSFLFAWAFIFFLPQSGLYPINAFVAEHFIYLPSIAVFAGAAWMLRKLLRTAVLYACLGGMVLSSCALTVARNYEWRDPLVFYSKILEVSPYSYTARMNLGVEYLNRKKFDRAEEEIKKALLIKPDRVEGYANLASLYYQAGRYQESWEQYRIVELKVPYFKAGEVQNNIGFLLIEMRRYDEALARLNLACRLDPSLSYPHYNSAHVLYKQGKEEEAIGEIMLSFGPGFTRPLGTRGFTESFRETLRAEDLQAPATFYNNLGVRLLSRGFEDWGFESLRKALAIIPDYADVHCNIGFFYLSSGDTSRARVAFRKALAADPSHAKAAALLKQCR